MDGIMLQPREQRWVCPNCDVTATTRKAEPHSQFHSCAGLHGLTTPMVADGVRCKVQAIEREDYIGREQVQLAPGTGRPVMSAVTTRDDGQDCTVYAPTASGNGTA